MCTVFVVLWAAFPTLPSVAASLLLAGGIAAALVAYGAEITVGPGGLRAGRASLPWDAVGRVAALDAAAAAYLRGPGMDPRAFLLLRGYVSTAVRVEVDDPDDPTPYWYVSTRRPEQLAAAIGTRGRTPAH